MARLALAASAGLAALIVAAIAVWFLAQSLLLAFEAVPLSPAVASLIVGLIGLLAAGLIAAIARVSVGFRRTAPPAASPAAGVTDAATELGGLLAQRLIQAGRAHPYGTIGTALVAGLVVGGLPELRGVLANLLKK
jgi:hypothetical protein